MLQSSDSSITIIGHLHINSHTESCTCTRVLRLMGRRNGQSRFDLKFLDRFQTFKPTLKYKLPHNLSEDPLLQCPLPPLVSYWRVQEKLLRTA